MRVTLPFVFRDQIIDLLGASGTLEEYKEDIAAGNVQFLAEDTGGVTITQMIALAQLLGTLHDLMEVSSYVRRAGCDIEKRLRFQFDSVPRFPEMVKVAYGLGDDVDVVKQELAYLMLLVHYGNNVVFRKLCRHLDEMLVTVEDDVIRWKFHGGLEFKLVVLGEGNVEFQYQGFGYGWATRRFGGPEANALMEFHEDVYERLTTP